MSALRNFFRVCVGICLELCCLPFTLYTKYSRTYPPTHNTIHKNSNRIAILVHGSGSTDTQFNIARRYLDTTQYTVHTIKLYDRDGRHTSIYDYTEQLKNFIDNIVLFQRDVRIVLVGNSMGGLVSALYHIKYHQANKYLEYDNRQLNHHRRSPQVNPMKICKIITISSPWYGSPLLNVPCCFMSKCTKRHEEMTPSSDLLTYIQCTVNRSTVHCIGGSCDLHVPYRYSLLQGSKHDKFFGSHSFMIISPYVWRHVDMLIQRNLECPNIESI